MAIKPFLGDIRYKDLDRDETLRQYHRDLLLYEQANALENIANNNVSNSQTYVSTNNRSYRDYLTNIDTIIKNDELLAKNKYAKQMGVDKNKDKYAKLCVEQDKLENTIHLKTSESEGGLIILWFIVAFIILAILFASPKTWYLTLPVILFGFAIHIGFAKFLCWNIATNKNRLAEIEIEKENLRKIILNKK